MRPAKRSNRQKIRYAVVGLGYISQIAVLPAFAHAKENSRLVALVSGDPRKLKALSKKYGVERTYSYETFGDCLKNGEVDAVYIALPNNMHRAYTVAAAEAGVHVLCEKPMAVDEEECRAMIAATDNARVKLMIAYRLHFERGNLDAIATIGARKIGEPRIFNSIFSQQVERGNSRLKADVGGGPIFDLGVYCINAARYLFKDEPVEAFAWNSSIAGDARFREVPEMTAGILKFPGERIAQFSASFGAADRSVYEVVGTKGVLKMDPAYEMVEPLKAEITIDGRVQRKEFKKRDQFAPELVYFSDCIIANKDPEPSGQEGLADVRIIDALRKSAETGKPVLVEQTRITQRPDKHQEISKTPVAAPPPLINAAAPGAE